MKRMVGYPGEKQQRLAKADKEARLWRLEQAEEARLRRLAQAAEEAPDHHPDSGTNRKRVRPAPPSEGAFRGE